MIILFSIFNIVFVVYLATRLYTIDRSALKPYFWPAFLFKMLAGLSLGLLYTYYYEVGDTFSFFSDGTELSSLARNDFTTYARFLISGDESFDIWQSLIFKEPRSLFMTKCISVVNLVTLDNYWITSLYFSFLSFIGTWLLVKTLVRLYPGFLQAAVIAFLFFPSFVFWSSGIIKESLVMPCLFYLTIIFLRLWHGRKIRPLAWIIVLLSIWIVWSLKYYYAAVFFPVVITSLLVRYVFIYVIKSNRVALQYAVWIILFSVPLFLVSVAHPNFDPERLLNVIVLNNRIYSELSAPGNLIHYYSLKPTILSFLTNAPWALVSGLFRPFLWEATTWPKFIVAFENLALLAAFFFALRNIAKLASSKYLPLIFALVVYVIVLCIFLALSTPNFGTLARYRIGFLPYVVFLLLIDNQLIIFYFRIKELMR